MRLPLFLCAAALAATACTYVGPRYGKATATDRYAQADPPRRRSLAETGLAGAHRPARSDAPVTTNPTTGAAHPAAVPPAGAEAAAERAPRLSMRVDSPATASTGRSMRHRILVRNDGTAPAENVVVVQTVPAEWRIAEVSGSGRAAANEVRWAIEAIAPGVEQVLVVDAIAEKEGAFTMALAASIAGRESATARSTTRVERPTGLELEVVDLDDPVEVGLPATYVITVTNRGAEADSEIRVRCRADVGLTPITTTGDAPGRIEGREVVFSPEGTLAPGAKWTLRILARGDQPADLGFAVALSSKNLGAAKVEADERTRFGR